LIAIAWDFLSEQFVLLLDAMSSRQSPPPSIPVIDLFAGPGGMGEGFSSLSHDRFRLSVSIEKDPQAHQTLRLRSAFRELKRKNVGPDIWSRWYHVLEQSPWQTVFDTLKKVVEPEILDACEFAEKEAWNLEMSSDNRQAVIAGIRERLKFAGFSDRPDKCLVIGGPPCQAYSVVGRSRNRGKVGYKAEDDHRHFLYKEYLNVLKEFQPLVFVMENVKGILTAQVEGTGIIESVMADLRNPGKALGGAPSKKGYRLLALSSESLLLDEPEASDFLVHAEDHGVPQTRHRVIIVGVRDDLQLPPSGKTSLKIRECAVSVKEAIGNLPPLRSGLSLRSRDTTWHEALSGEFAKEVIDELLQSAQSEHAALGRRMKTIGHRARLLSTRPTGDDRYVHALGEPARATKPAKKFHGWVQDRTGMPFVANHESRSHRADDLVRYLFVSLFGREHESPRLRDFPRSLLPSHKNIDPDDPDSAIFKDRFRVQVATKPATTITSHIAKDGHYFIHYDSEQCRSLTVREGARLQSFPDNYIFLGNRTSQYTQVGNAVPPLLAKQFAEAVHKILKFNDI
jgi:DNA (cytosine-5)-methyltransferase 1